MNFSDLPQEFKEKLDILNTSEFFMIPIFFSTGLTYLKIKLDKQKLITSLCDPENLDKCPDTFWLKIVGNLSITIAAVYFYNLAKKAYENNPDAENCGPTLNYVASIAVIFTAILRLIQIFYDEKFRLQEPPVVETIESVESDIV